MPNVTRDEQFSDTGVLSLVLAMNMMGRLVSPDQLRHQSGLGAEALDQDGFVRLAHTNGIKVKKISTNWEKLSGLTLPVIAVHRHGRFMVLAKIIEDKILLRDPSEERPLTLSRDDFEKIWSGEIFLLALGSGKDQDADFRRPFGLAWFLPLLNRYRGMLTHVMMASLFIQIFALVTPLFVMVVIDKVLTTQGISTLNVLVVGLLAIAAFDLAIGGLRRFIFTHTANRIDAELVARVFRHLTRLPLTYFQTQNTGDMVARIKELENIRGFLAGSALTGIIDFAFTFVFLVVMYQFSPVLTFITVGFVASFLLLHGVMAPFLRHRLLGKFQQGAESQTLLVEAVGGMETVKALAVEPQMQRQWEKHVAERAAAGFSADKLSSITQQLAGFLTKVLVAIILWVGAQKVLAGEMTAGQLIAMNMLVGRVSAPAMRLAQLWQQVQQIGVSFNRIADIMDMPAEPIYRQDRVTLPPLKGRVEFQNVNFRYIPDGPKALQDVSFRAEPGQIIGIVGASGSGKSTVARLIQRLFVPESGRVLIDGMDISQTDPAWLRRQIGTVLQDNFLFNKSIHDNISLSVPLASQKRVMAAARLAGADNFIRQLPEGYDTVIGERGAILSGGQKQRIALARALMANPPILVLDEATSSLDSESERIVQQNMRTICKNRTVFLIAHRLSTLRHADKILVLDNGRLVEAGNHNDLIKAKGRYAYLHALQSGKRLKVAEKVSA